MKDFSWRNSLQLAVHLNYFLIILADAIITGVGVQRSLIRNVKLEKKGLKKIFPSIGVECINKRLQQVGEKNYPRVRKKLGRG